MSNDVAEAQARLSESISRAQNAIRDRLIESTNACADVLDAISDQVEDSAKWPDLQSVVRAAVVELNAPEGPKLFVCAMCFHKIDGPMIAQQTSPTTRFLHWPECPSPNERIEHDRV